MFHSHVQLMHQAGNLLNLQYTHVPRIETLLRQDDCFETRTVGRKNGFLMPTPPGSLLGAKSMVASIVKPHQYVHCRTNLENIPAMRLQLQFSASSRS